MTTPDARRFAPASSRNREPILAVLTRFVLDGAAVLEIASGSGEHATFLAERLPVASWQPSDPHGPSRASIDAWTAHLGSTRVLPAIALDVMERPWPLAHADVIVNINMIHSAPWAAAPSNEAFDASLRSRDPAWGVRDLEAVTAEAERHGLHLEEVVPMPANNLSVVLRRSPP